MVKIQYGIAGFFIGVFVALLLAIIESKLIDGSLHPARLFIVVSLTIVVFGMAGMIRGLKMANKK